MGTFTTVGSLWTPVLWAEFILMTWVLGLGCVVLAVIALIKCLPKNADMFFVHGKRTKGFWMGMTGGAVALTSISLLTAGPFTLLFMLGGACMAAVYLADVDPAVSGRPNSY